MKLRPKDIPEVRETLRKRQRNRCPLCGCSLSENKPSLDHDHDTGYVRGVLCRNCNQVEGRLLAWIKRGARGKSKEEFLKALIRYWRKHESNPQYIHPQHGKRRRRKRRKK